ncbi:signal peptide peptidase SppA [Exilibacterium tricleocarpae]|uniref:Signal peptide peptidase SppA n=1 Tax=Exilibacterium tricleocarpae TaxID=2591008 RepID=A0A545UBG7_9GAMM|nr:signal peptide peptidase SppA [Exilibacterium tricleocarpae]TQV86809.1 signal peptide peptidase SppA [Exilibacterium tricleocarpae]
MAESSRSLIRRFFSGLWRGITWLRVALTNLLFLAILAVIAFALMPEQPRTLPDQAALHLAPSGFLVDQRTYIDPVSQLLGDSQWEETETVVRDLVTTIDAAARDPRITALVLDLSQLIGGGISKLEEVGQALATFKDSGKPILAVSDDYSQEQYYLASYADEVYLHPMGAVLLTGYGSYRNYYKSALDKLAVNFHVFRVGSYKDFVEPYTRDSMSDASREHNLQWLNQLWGIYTSRVEHLRNLPKGAVDDYISNLDTNLVAEQGDFAALAFKAGLVDHLASRLEVHQTLQEKFGPNADNTGFKAIDYRDYLAHIRRVPAAPGKRKIGLLVASGAIVDGEQPAGTIGSDSLARLLRQTRERSDLSALVLRVDSGGGSSFASEVIREELAATRRAGLPIIVSMGSVAASGGYWITAAADEVWATPTTITGSIGVFGMFPTLEKSLQKLGISTDGLGTTELAGALRLDRPLPPIAKNVLQQSVEDVYRRFLVLVAEARNTTPEAVHDIAQGRVWSGATAKDLGLIDQLGYLQDAIAAAAAKAGISDYSVELIERQLSPKEQLLKELASESAQLRIGTLSNWVPRSIRQTWGALIEPFKLLDSMNDPGYVYAQCLACPRP